MTASATQQASQSHQANAARAAVQRDDAVWNELLSRVQQDPVVARAMLDLFETKPELMARRAGAFVAARVTVQRDRIRYARAYRKGQRVASAARLAVKATAALLRVGFTGVKLLAKWTAAKLADQKVSQVTRAVDRREPAESARVAPAAMQEADSAFPTIDWTALDNVAATSATA
jgi:hypothetical protein